MRKHLSGLGLAVALLLLTPCVFATDSVWQDVDLPTLALNKQGVAQRNPKKFRRLALNEPLFRQKLSAGRVSARALQPAKAALIDIPLPDGESVRVVLEKTAVLAAGLALKYPEISTWKAKGIKDSRITGRVDFTAYGFHAMLTMADGDTVFVERERQDTGRYYRSFSKRENADSFTRKFECELHHRQASLFRDDALSAKTTVARQASDLVTYRLALAATGEYTQFHGGSVAQALSAMTTTINRVNGINERDLGVRFQLVTGGGSLIYTDPDTDPYTNDDASAILEENIINLNATIGPSQYDIGHVFTAGNASGLAIFEAACNTLFKAGGVTGFPSPGGDAFDIDFVAHELGHQLGATHTFNSETLSCGGGNRTAAAAVEPGSGSTIMAYAGICGANNLQNNSDAVYHAFSISQVFAYTRNHLTGRSCGARTAVSNQDPVAGAGSDYVIPANTPIVLSATGSDPDSDNITYSWEQNDMGAATNVNVDSGDNAIIRSFLPVATAQRYIPRLLDLFNNRTLRGEHLPETSRDLNFVLSVRDGKGGIDSDTMKISVFDTATAFKVTSQESPQTLLTNQAIEVSWDVAGTNSPPVNCSKVDIQLLRVNGEKNMLLANVDNDGRQQLTIPAITPVMSAARIMLKCNKNDNSFFNISAADIAIEKGGEDVTPPVITLNSGNPLTIVQGTLYTDAGATALDNIDGVLLVSVSGSVNTAVVGTYTISYTATDASGNTSNATRTVNVILAADTTAPVITLQGNTPVNIVQGTAYTDAGATALDDRDGMVNVITTGSVQINNPGVYTISYTATDAAGNTSNSIRTVNVNPATVIDTQSPQITILGENPVSVTQGESYLEAGATALDNVDSTVEVSVSGSVNTATPGSYTITYSATDSSGNTAKATRVVRVLALEQSDEETPQNANNLSASGGGGAFTYLLIPLLLLAGMRRKRLAC